MHPWYHLNLLRFLQPHPVPTDRKRNIGRTRLHLLQISAEPLGKEFGAILLAALHPPGSSLEEEWVRLLGFVTAFISINLPFFQTKVNEKQPPYYPKNCGLICIL